MVAGLVGEDADHGVKLVGEDTDHGRELKKYEVRASDRKYNIWLRDPLAVRTLSKEMAEEKLNYLHCNPLQTHWNLCKIPDEYRFSSAAFYLTGRDEFNLATNIMQAF
jgi:putative transposase